MELQKRKKKNRIRIPLLILTGTVVAGALILFGLFHIRTVDVIGNEFYSADEIIHMVMSDSMAENSLYLTWKYSDPAAADALPFLNGVEVDMVSPYHVQIRVYEKTIAGYLMFSGSRVYFDTDGNVVEISGEEREGVAPFSGIPIGQPEVGEKLPVNDPSFLDDIVEESRLIYQSGLSPDEVFYDENQELILYFGSRRVMMGDSSYMEGKLLELSEIYPQMEGLSGTLHMENYTPDTTTFSFKKGERGSEEEELLISVNNPAFGEEEGGEAQDGEAAEDTPQADSAGSGYQENPDRITTDADGNQIYTDDLGNVTTNMDMPYLGEDGKVVTDGYGYIDPYTGAYILN